MLKVNEYFDGKVKSIAFQAESLPETVGVMEAGDYEFSTAKKETMTVISGQMQAWLPGQEGFQTFAKGEQFIVGANQKFKLKIEGQAAYLCRYE
ncbi:MAG: hypothetical protein CSB48_10915 [Proteobacteria bacterium]|nr:MAG: hypothetical protein CSB48_10915 [Pseudomonadota bacterium]PIE40052.1 MAG: hypothetical protein CSA51_02680 [Gammaproteobacteria bacterium]